MNEKSEKRVGCIWPPCSTIDVHEIEGLEWESPNEGENEWNDLIASDLFIRGLYTHFLPSPAEWKQS